MPNDFTAAASTSTLSEPRLPGGFPILPDEVIARFPSLADYNGTAESFWRRVRASITDSAEEFSRAASATTDDVNNIVARLDNGDIATALQNLSAAVGVDGATSTYILELQAKVGAASDSPDATGTLFARYKAENQARATADDALASQIEDLTAAYQSADFALQAQVTTITTTYATKTYAEARRDEAIAAAAGDATAKVSTETAARVAADGSIHAQWGVAIDINGRVTGRVHLDGTGATSSFKVGVGQFVVENDNGSITAMDIRPGVKIVFGADIQSDNYSPGVAGWAFTRSGDIDANSGTFRGHITAATIDIDDDGAVRVARTTFQNTYDGGTDTRTIGIELAYYSDKPTHCFIDFHATTGVDNNARIIRSAGANGEFSIEQQGSGNLWLRHFGAGDIYLDPAGGGVVRFGAYTAAPVYDTYGLLIASGYITIKDRDGNVRELLCA